VDRLARNPLRILDSKDPRDRPIADAAPAIDDFLSADAGAFFEAVVRGLEAAGVRWTRNSRLVRGLDYYRHTAFEFITDRLGAQGTVVGGGRYDGLIETLGGPPTPAVGWAAGIERLAMLIDTPAREAIEIVLVPMGQAAETLAIGLLADIRRRGHAADMAYRGNMKKRMQKADATGARLALILGEDEIARGEVAVRDLATGAQDSIAMAGVIDSVEARLR